MAVHGLYVEKTRTGAIYGIQVEDEVARRRWSITPFEYASQHYQPPIAMLLDITGYLNRQPGPYRVS